MFHHQCTSCGRDELIFPDQWHGLETTETGFVLSFTCWCGTEQTTVIERELHKAHAA